MGKTSYRKDLPHDRFQAVREFVRGQRKPLAVLAIAAVGIGAWAISASATSNDRSYNTVQSHNITAEEQKIVTDKNDNTDDQAPPQTKETIQDDGNGNTTEVHVNGEAITVPENGTYRRTTDTGNGTTDIKVESRNQSSSSGDGSSNSSSSKLEVNVQSNSSTSQ